MSKKTIELEVIYKYKIEIDEENEILIECSSYHFGTNLPVIANYGVIVKDVEFETILK